MLQLRWDQARRWNDAFNWLGTDYDSGQAPRNVVLVEVARPGGTRYFSNSRWIERGGSVVAEPRLASEVRFQRRANLSYWGSGRAVFGLGAIELLNPDGGLDDWMFSADLRGAVVTVRMGPDDVPLLAMPRVARAIVDRVETVGEQSVRLVLLDAGDELSLAIQTATFSAGPLAGKLRPVLFGRCFSVPVMHSGAPSLLYSIHDSGAASSAGGLTFVGDVRDQGVALTSGSGWAQVASGEDVGVQLLAAPSGRITVFAGGPTRGFGAFSPARLHDMVDAMLRIRFGWDASRIDDATLAALNTETNAVLGRYIDSAVTYAQVLTEIADSISAFWYITPDGVLTMTRWRVPTGTPLLEITPADIDGDVQIEFDAAPGLATSVLTGRNWHVHSPNELAGSVRDTADGVSLQQAYRGATPFTVADCYRKARGASSAIVADTASGGGGVANRPTADQGMPTLLASATNEAPHRAALYAEPRWFYRLQVSLDARDAATLLPGDLVRLTCPRFGLSAGRLLRVVSIEGTVGEGLAALVLWGGGPTP